MSTLSNAVNNAGGEKNLALNLSITKIMHIGTCTAGANDTASTPLVVDGERIAEVSSFKYLGSWKTTNGDCSLDIRSRIAMAKERMLQLVDIWKDHNISRQPKIRIMHALVWSVLLYGAESWTLRKTDERRIQAAEMWCYRRLLRVSWMEKRTNESFLVELGVQRQLLARVKIRKLTYFGHTCRPSACDLVRDVMFVVVDGKKSVVVRRFPLLTISFRGLVCLCMRIANWHLTEMPGSHTVHLLLTQLHSVVYYFYFYFTSIIFSTTQRMMMMTTQNFVVFIVFCSWSLLSAIDKHFSDLSPP